MSSISPTKPYVGVTGVTKQEELEPLLQVFEQHGLHNSAYRTGMVGFLASKELVTGGSSTNPRHVKDLPSLVKLAEKTGTRALPVVHYETNGEHEFATHLINIFHDLYRDHLCRTAQINGTPSKKEIERILEAYPEMQLIYQVRPTLMKQGVVAVLDEIDQHRGAFQHVLIDPSCGQGKDIVIDEAIKIHVALKRTFGSDVIVGFAGGFNRQNAAQRVCTLVRNLSHPFFSVDAEKGLRSEMNDQLSLPHVQGYVQGVMAGFRTARTGRTI